MKKFSFFLLSVFFINQFSFSQTSPPQLISYQGMARDASGNVLSVQPIGILFLIHQGAANGTVVFSESHSVTTNSLGLFALQIGSVNTGSFQTINWSQGPYFLEVQMDPTGGTSYTSIGTQQMLSVPYALYAKNSYSASTSYSASYALGSYSTVNAPPITITTNTSNTSTTLNITQGSNTSSVSIDFPPPSPATVTLNSSGIASVTPTSGNSFTVDVPPPSLNVTSGASDATITITQGTATSTQTLSFPPVNINGTTTGVASSTVTANSFTVNVPPPSLNIASGASDATITITQGTATSTQTLSFPPASVPNVSINATGIVTVTPNSGTAFTIGAPTPNFSSGTGINVFGFYPNYTITNTAPNQTVSLNAGTNVTVTGTYPNFNISSTPTLSLAGNTLSISGGNAVTLPASNVTLTTAGIAIVTPTTGNNFNINVPAPSISATSNTTTGVATITLTQGSSTSTTSINMPLAPNHTITGVSPVVVTPTAGSVFNLSLTQQTLTITGNGSTSSYSLSSPNYGGVIALPKPTLTINAPHTSTTSTGGYSSTFTIVPPTLSPAASSTTNIASVTNSPSTLNYTVNVPPPALSISNNTATGQSTLTLTQGPVTTTALISTGAPNEWHLTGNSGTNPSIHFIGTSDAQDLVFRTSNTEKMRISSGGNIGIGTSTPLYPLHTVYTGTNSNVHYIDYTSTATSSPNSAIFTYAKSTMGGNIFGGYFQVYNSSSSSVATAVKAFATSNASLNYGIDARAIGTTTNTNYAGYFYASGGTNNYGVYTEINNTSASLNNVAIYAESSGSNGVAGKFVISNSTNNSSVLDVDNYGSGNLATFTGNGNVGIGTNAPQSFLHVTTPSSASSNVFQIGNGNQPTLEWLFDVDGVSNLTIKNEGTGYPYLSMTNSNIVGINTTTAIGFADFIVSYNSAHTSGYAGMYVNAGATNGWPFYGYAKGNVYKAWSYIDNSDTWILNNGGFNRIAVTTAGDMGVGIISPSSKFHVDDNSLNYVARFVQNGTGTVTASHGLLINFQNFTNLGTGNYYIGFATSGFIKGSISGNGGTGVLYNTTSDKRLKENIQDFTGALELIDKMEPKIYNFIGYKKMEHGFLAQDLQKVYPEAVSGSPDDDPKEKPMMIDYSKLTPVLTAGIKELMLITKEQQKQIAELKTEIQNLQEEIKKLKSK